MGKPVSYVQKIMDDLSVKGVLEYNYDTPDGSRQYVLPIFVPGAAELMNMNLEQVEKYPQIAKFFERMAFLPLTKITPHGTSRRQRHRHARYTCREGDTGNQRVCEH